MAKYGRQSRVSKENKFRLFYGLSRLLPTRGVVERDSPDLSVFKLCVHQKSDAAENERRGINGNFLAEKLSLIFSRNEAPHYGNAHTQETMWIGTGHTMRHLKAKTCDFNMSFERHGWM